ncbi:tRNA1(Val) (adenine(37)-N6)-methyltransferase [Porcipelethomonas sp.]|uniref:tRNA1(Val) (adenine(37)-N6)-methyltransferase n=1 Tax=Porcipelethomonas sp. TaxID=2981675 RepID=UPI003EF97F87
MEEFKFEKLSDSISVCVSREHGFGTDAFLLAHFSGYKQKDIVCDLGTGCGIIPLIMQRSRPPKHTYAVDIQPLAVKQLEISLEKNGIDSITPVCADLKELWQEAPLSGISLVTCNPPYKAANAGIESTLDAHKIARHEILCSIDDVCKAASRLLKFGGRLCLCNRPERLADVITAMKNNGIEPKKLRFVSKNPQTAPWLFLIEGKKGSKPFMKVLPQLYVWNGSGYSQELEQIYSMGLENKEGI